MLNRERRIFWGVVFSVGMDYLGEYWALGIKYFRVERSESVFEADNKRECTHR
jgi:hypothetical protein